MERNKGCALCPRACGADRAVHPGACGCGALPRVARVMLHRWEEPPISGERGAGAVFFTGCPLGCVFCQNGDISTRENASKHGGIYTEKELSDTFLTLAEDGAATIDLVSPTPFTDVLIRAVADARKRGLTIPVVWNTGGYEKRETVSSLRGTADVFLDDFKFLSPALSGALAGAPDYGEYALAALGEMIGVAGEPRIGGDGVMRSGVIVRHLVLPGCSDDSIAVIRAINESYGSSSVLLSLMSQYTPDFFRGTDDGRLDRSLRRRVTTYEYEKVREEANRLGFDGFMQERGSASASYTPVWDEPDNERENNR
ncbi:MAG: radical SAM protein [Clostridia bacterium]|nr:radical SAM protein [Clostridia bacterium]